MSENENITYKNIWETIKAMLIGKFMAPNAYIRKEEKLKGSKLSFHLKKLEKDQNKLKASRGKKIIRIRAGINEIENRNIKKKINETMSSSFVNINEITKLLTRLRKKREDKNYQYQK